jgi:hypothetical protein
MVSVVEHERGNKYKLYHQIVLQPYMGPSWSYNPGDLCDETVEVHVCLEYNTNGSCKTSEYRNACVGSFLGLSSETCNRSECTTRGGLSFVADSWDGFIQDLAGHINNSNGVLDLSGSDPLVYSYPHGRLCVSYGSEIGDPPITPPGDFVLQVTKRTAGKNAFADLVWSGATTSSVDIWRNGGKIATTSNSGSYSDRLQTTGTYVYQVCEAGTDVCSNNAEVTH